MSLIYNILLLIGMNRKVKQYVVSNYFKSFNSDNIFIRLVCLLFILAALIICLYLLYRAASNALYMYNLKTDFYKLQDMGLNVKNYNILYIEEIKKKYILKHVKLKKETIKSEFKNENVIGFIPNNYIVLDIDTKDGIQSADFLIEKIPKDTVYEKTPNGYHYYFENDTGKSIHTYVQLEINNVKYSVDILGIDSIVTMSPSVIQGKNYYWINSIFTHKPAKISENMWILDFIENSKNKPFSRKFDSAEFEVNIKNAFIIIDNLHIENYFRFFIGNIKKYSKKMKLLNGVIYIYDDNYYFMTRSSFGKYKNKKYLLEKLKDIITELKPSCIVDLSIIYSNYFKSENICQITSAVIANDFKNYKYSREFTNYIETTNIYVKTKYLVNDTVTINNYDNTKVKYEMHDTSEKNNVNKLFIGSESIYVTILLSNYFNIPNVCLGSVHSLDNNDIDTNNISKDNEKKIMTSFLSIF